MHLEIHDDLVFKFMKVQTELSRKSKRKSKGKGKGKRKSTKKDFGTE